MEEPTYTLTDLVLAITMEDVVNNLNGWDEDNPRLTPEQVELLRDSQRSFEKAMEWGLMEHIWSTLHDVGVEVLEANGMPLEDEA